MNPFLPTRACDMADRRDSRRWASKASEGCGKAVRWSAAAGAGSAAANTLVRAGVGTRPHRRSRRRRTEQPPSPGALRRGRRPPGLPKAVAAARETAAAPTPTVAVEPVVADVDHANIEQLCEGVRRDRRRDGQFRDPVSAERRGRLARPALDLRRLRGRRGADDDHRAGARRPACGACLPDCPPPGSTPTCDTAGILGPIVGLIAAIEAIEAMKILSGHARRRVAAA